MREIRIGNCVDVLRELPSEFAQCVVTSPPYWNLRVYSGEQNVIWGGDPNCDHGWQSHRYYVEQSSGQTSRETFSEAGEENIERLKAARWREDSTCRKCGAWYGAFGMEPTVELYVAHMVEIFREIKRVMRPDACAWLNLGDSYAGSSSATPSSIKPKDLMLVPSRVAIALQSNGWWVRAMVIWEKVNCMPESARDRPTESHEYILLLAKSERYFYDADAVREAIADATIKRNRYPHAGSACKEVAISRKRKPGEFAHPAGRNLRSVWQFATLPYPGAHFAVFPPELPRRCILAGTPPKVCAKCGTPWQRQTQREVDNTGYPNGPGGNYITKGKPSGSRTDNESGTLGKVARYRVATTGWHPGCRCFGEPEKVTAPCVICNGSGKITYQFLGDSWEGICEPCEGTGEMEQMQFSEKDLVSWPTRPAIVLDPFAGSGTTLMVAEQLGRWWIGIDICEQYSKQIKARTDQRSLAAAFECTGEIEQ